MDTTPICIKHIASAWLVENHDMRPHEYMFMCQGTWQWTTDIVNAMKFADRDSAEQACEEAPFDSDIQIHYYTFPYGFPVR